VQAGGDPDALERPLAVESPADHPEHRHLLGRPVDPGRALAGQP
jgi:hypothetical protein